MLDCVLIVVAYRSSVSLKGLLATVPGSALDLTWRVVVVNNDPSEDLGPLVAEHPGVQLIEAGENLGYAGGLNVGLAAAPPSRWTAFLNPDVRLGEGALAQMARSAGEHTAVVPLMIDDLGVVHPSLRREPTVLGSLGDAFLGRRWPTRPPWLGETLLAPDVYQHPGTVDWATGAVLLVPTAITGAVGPWDAERFFLYSEETDYSRRLREAGCAVRFLPTARVMHEGGSSGTSDALHALQEVNRVRYFHKWHTPPAVAAFWAVAVLNNALRGHRRAGRASLGALLSRRQRAALPGGAR